MYKNYIFDLYGTLVDINTNEWNIGLWKKMAEFYAFYGALYKPSELKEAYEDLCRREEKKLKYFVNIEKALMNAGFELSNMDWSTAYGSYRDEAKAEFIAGIRKKARKESRNGSMNR